MRDSGIFSIHGTVVANTDSWVFYIFIIICISHTAPTYLSVIGLHRYNIYEYTNTDICIYIYTCEVG